MDGVEAVKDNNAYAKYKLLVKKWEKDFKEKTARIPSKLDIKEAPAKVRYAYKQYFQMKSAALEESLLDCQFDDEYPPGSPEFPLSDSMFDLSSQNSDFGMENLPSSTQIVELLSSAKKSPVKKTFKPAETTENKRTSLAKRLSDNISKKLFQNSKFSMRNPRKSNAFKLSQSNSTDCDTSVIETKVLENNLIIPHSSLSDLEGAEVTTSLCMQNSVEESSKIPVNQLMNTLCNAPLRQINLGWLDRSLGQSFDSTKESPSQNTCDKYGLTNINIIPVDKISSDFIENSESETEECVNNKSIQPALKKRKLNNKDILPICINNITNSEESNPFKISDQENEGLIKTKKESQTNVSRAKKQRKSKAVKKLEKSTVKGSEDTLEPPNLDDYIPIGLENDITPRFSKESSLFSITTKLTDVSPQENSLKTASASKKLRDKVKSGTLNENFVKINIQKKVFVRGKKSFNYSKYKKQQWKDKKALAYGMEFPEGGKIACFKCGNFGHMARYCTAHRGDTLLPLEVCPTDEIPTLNDMENKIDIDSEKDGTEIEHLSQYASSAIPDSFLQLLSQTSETCSQNSSAVKDIVQPLFPINQNGETPKEVKDALQMFGHQNFRGGQEQAIMRILSGLSTLLILSTGSGKSLCYQLPAYIYSKHYKCITLVISPLVSLMDDQVLSMPEFLRAGCLHTNQPPTQRQKIMQYLKDGELNVLLISPEALISGDRSHGFGSLFKNLPPIAFACIDEAHCVSQWSHNFRPSYLMICRVLREKLKVNCILGLTATASQPTIKSVIEHINVPDGSSGVIKNPTLPENLILSVSYEKDKDRSLITLLGSDAFSAYNSIIVYCIRRDECTRVAGVLRSSLQEPGKITTERGRKRKQLSYLAEAYHAGLSAAQRRKIQDNFMNGSLRIIVATVAFGMGINKSDIRCIIHYNMPKSFESYVQEVGRAGRDGKIAHCHVFMNRDCNDKNELLKHIHSNTIDRNVIRKLLQKVFIPCECKKNLAKVGLSENRCKGHEVAFPIDETVEELDIASENISTMLCYLELHPKKYIQVLNNCYVMCKIFSYGGPDKLLEAAKNCPPLAMAYTLGAKINVNITKSNILEFPVIDVAAAIGWESGITKYHLKNLEWVKHNGSSKRSSLKVEFHTLGLRIRAPGDLTPSELDEMLDILHQRVQSQENTMLVQLEEIDKAFSKVAKNSVNELFTTSGTENFEEQSNGLKNIIRDYFERDNILDSNTKIEKRPLDEGRAIGDIRALISSYKDCSFTGRAIARILQGIPSPNYSAIVWGRCKFWRSHIHEDFHGLTKLATQQIIDMRY